MVARFGAFTEAPDLRTAIRVDIEASRRPAEVIRRPGGRARHLFEPEYALEYFPETDLLHFVEPGVVAQCDPVAGSIRIAVDPADPRARFVASHLFFSVLLLEALKRRGRYAVHAAAVGLGGRAALLAGAAGAGKSTLAFASVRAGCTFLGDDLALLDRSAGGLRICAFPDAIELARDATRYFPDLVDLFAPAAGGASLKRPFHPSDRGPVVLAWVATPALLLFPAFVGAPAATVVELSADDALVRLVPNVVRTEPRASQAHLDVLADLARTVPAYRLDVADPLAVPAVIRELLSRDVGIG